MNRTAPAWIRPTRPVRIRALALGLVLVALVACTGGGADTNLGVSTVSKPLPHLSGPALHPEDGHIATSDFHGTPLVVNFWATWCGPCRQEQGILQGLWQRYHDRGVMFLGVDQRDDPAAASAQLQDLGVTYPNMSDLSGAYANDFGFVGLPDTYVVDRSGTIRYQVIGRISDPSQLATLIDRVLAGSAGA